MNIKALSLVAVVLLVAACSEKPKEEATPNTTAAVEQPPVQQPDVKTQITQVGDRIYFAFDKSDITSESQATLQKQAQILTANPSVTITIEGNCDERGTREYNLGLGERRANATKQALVALGVAASRINTISYGKERPIASGHDEASWAQNRNGHTVVN